MNLVEKYNVPGPRYTSYPTVPFWDNPPTEEQWESLVKDSFQKYNEKEGVSIYIHLPYCESLCTFCGCTTRITVNHAVERPYIDALLKEWALYLKTFDGTPNVKEIHLGGGTPTFFSPEHLRELIQGIRDTANVLADASLGFEASPRSTSFEHLKTMAELGFTRISFGIQDFDTVVQKTINRIQSFDQVKRVTDWSRELGYTSVNYDIVYGLPMQTIQSIENTIDLVNLLRPDRIAYYSYAHVPWVKPGQRSFTEKDLPSGQIKHQMYVQGKALLKQNGYVEIGMDHFALPDDELTIAYRSENLHRNFMGYTTQPSKLMVGLGVSSIGDTWTAFAQNVKTVEEYIERVSNGRFPIFRGHIQTDEDLQIRQLVLDIMCHFKAEIDQYDKSISDISGRLSELEKDKLIIRTSRGVKVTKRGRPFVRNICMALDQRLLRKNPETQIFSMTV